MVNTKLTRKAMTIAYNAHMNQFDKAGVPYIYHPIHLAEQMQTEEECIVALLHDVVEDTDITMEELEKEFSEKVIEALKLLTHDKNIEYMDYINKIKNNDIAKKVKIADLKHNSDETRLDKITIKDVIRRKKYKEALKSLENREGKMKIYVSHSSEYDYINKVYEPIKKSDLIQSNYFFFPHENKIINSKDAIFNSNLIIAEVSLPSTGQGIELGWANSAKVPIVCIYEKNAKISSGLKFITDKFIEYENTEDMIIKITSYIRNLENGN